MKMVSIAKRVSARTLNGIIFFIVVLCFLGSVPVSAALERSGRWLTYDGAYPYLVGYDLQQLFTESSYTEAQVQAKIDTLAAYGVTCFRIWLNTWFMGYDDYFPYTYSGGKFNIDSFSSTYWTRVKNLITYAKSKGIIVEVVVFSEYPHTGDFDLWTARKVCWRISENSNGVFSDVDGDLYPQFFTVNYAQAGKNLTTYQVGLANKAINELKSIGNVFFQVHNEFPGISGTGQYVNEVHGWQEYMADYFHNTKGAITSVHSHEAWGMNLYGLDYWKSRASVDILNFHPYSSTSNSNINDIGSMFGTLYTYGKVLMFDESHRFENSSYTDTVTREMWAAFTNGIYYLAYQGDSFIIGDPGWVSRAGRVLTLKNISELGDWHSATRNPTLVTAGPGQYWQGIANSGNFYVYYFTGTKTTTAVSMNLPAGTYSYKWFDTRAWDANGIASGQVTSAGAVSIPAPATANWNSPTGVALVISKTSSIPDTTPPSAPGTIRDGTGTTDMVSTTLTTQLSANWTAATDAQSAISGYQYAIGTNVGGTNTLDWQTLGNVLAVTKTGLSLSVGTTYYFSVKAVSAGGTGTARNSNGQAVISTAADTTPPGAPAAVRDGTSTTADSGSTNSTTQLSANWTAATDNESTITNYQYAIGTSAGGTNTLGWQTLGNVLAVTKTGLSLSVGTTYYFSVKAVNGAGLSGSTANSNGQYVNTINSADTTLPSSIAQVRDGNDTGVDAGVTYLTDELSANWDNSADVESGISRYYYAIGSLPGTTDITGWTDNGVITNVTETGLNLTIGATYYFSVKAENGVSLQSNSTNSNGQLVLSMDSQGPLISNVSVQGITNAGTTITWETDEPSTSRVEYGLTASYGSLTGEYIGMNTAHSVTLTGLLNETQYHFRVISKDGSGNESTSVDYTFTTLSTLNTQPSSPAYPNPYSLSKGEVIKFKVGAAGSETGEVKIYTMNGKLVRKLTAQSTNEIHWDGKNDDGKTVARGVYIYKIIESNGDRTEGKIGIIK